MKIDQPLVSATHNTNTASSPRQAVNKTSFTPSFPPPGALPPPPPGARPPMMRRSSRFDPMETTAEEERDDELGPRHPLRRVRESDDAPPEQRSNSEGGVILPGIKALLNAAEAPPPLVSPFADSFTFHQSPGVSSPCDSPTSRTSRISSFASSIAEGQGWWAPEERSGSAPGFRQGSRGSISRGPLDEEPDFKRRRSDLAPTLPDADEIARLKWQAQSRNASFPASGSISGASSLRTMLYPPPSTSSRGSISGLSGMSGRPLVGSPLSPRIESPFDVHVNSSRSSPMTGPLGRSFAELTTQEHSPLEAGTPTRGRSPVERRPSMYSRSSLSNESVPQLPPSLTASASQTRRESVVAGSGAAPREPAPQSEQQQQSSAAAQHKHQAQRISLTRPPSPESSSKPAFRRSSLAELIMANSGDDVAMASGRFTSAAGPGSQHHSPPASSLFLRRESTESIHSVTSLPPAVMLSGSVGGMDSAPSFSGLPFGTDHDQNGAPVPRDQRNAGAMVPPPPPQPPHGAHDPRRPFKMDEDEIAGPKGDPGMRGMEVLAESARRVADAERKDSVDDREMSPSKSAQTQPSPSAPSAGSAAAGQQTPAAATTNSSGTGPKYTCAFCAKTFSRPSSLRIHTYSHTGERPFVCKEPSCRRRFSVQSNLKRHAKVHQLQTQQAAAQIGNPHQRGGPAPHPMHVPPGAPLPHPSAVYGYPPRHPPPPHPHMMHPQHRPPPGYGPPHPGWQAAPGGPHGHPGGYDGGPVPGHFAPQPPGHRAPGPGVMGVPPNEHMPHYVQVRRHSHDVDAGPGRSGMPGGGGGGAADRGWVSEDEVDELDEDEP